MKTTSRPAAFVLAFVLTLSMLIGIDQLAQTEAAPATMAQASAPRA